MTILHDRAHSCIGEMKHSASRNRAPERLYSQLEETSSVEDEIKPTNLRIPRMR